VRADITAVLAEGGGLAAIDELLRAVPERSVRRAIARGELIRLHPRIYAAAGNGHLAASTSAVVRTTSGALSHQTALSSWQLHTLTDDEPRHMTIEVAHRVSPREGIVATGFSGCRAR
jgi:predicted transcriptional regulator of viral defense system